MEGLHSTDRGGGGVSDSEVGLTTSSGLASEARAGGGPYSGVFLVVCAVEDAGAILRARRLGTSQERCSPKLRRLLWLMW
jgi:hypothetical protein